jgi:hypothetical protein
VTPNTFPVTDVTVSFLNQLVFLLIPLSPLCWVFPCTLRSVFSISHILTDFDLTPVGFVGSENNKEGLFLFWLTGQHGILIHTGYSSTRGTGPHPTRDTSSRQRAIPVLANARYQFSSTRDTCSRQREILVLVNARYLFLSTHGTRSHQRAIFFTNNTSRRGVLINVGYSFSSTQDTRSSQHGILVHTGYQFSSTRDTRSCQRVILFNEILVSTGYWSTRDTDQCGIPISTGYSFTQDTRQ